MACIEMPAMSITAPSLAAAPRDTRRAAPLVHALDQDDAFQTACAELMRIVRHHCRPDALIGIRTGGLTVAERMARTIPEQLPVLPLTSRRAGTGAKSRIKVLPSLLKRLPRPAVDGLRVAELKLLSRRRRRSVPEQYVDPEEAEAIRCYLANLPSEATIVVVDDAVDSGVTMAAVLRLLRSTCRADIAIRSAAITVTLANPLVEPDYALYRGILCRFPWSFDATR